MRPSLVPVVLLVAACAKAPLGRPLSEPLADAASYRTEAPADLAPLEQALVDHLVWQAQQQGQSLRPDHALTQAARAMALLVRDDASAQVGTVQATELTTRYGSPLELAQWGSFADRRSRFPALDWAGWIDPDVASRPMALGVGAWDDEASGRSYVAVVVADDSLGLSEAVPRAGTTAIAGTVAGANGVRVVTGPELAEHAFDAGSFRAELAPGTTRVDVIQVGETPDQWSIVGVLDLAGAEPPPPLPADGAPEERVLAALNALRADAGLAPHERISGVTPCGGWVEEIAGEPVLSRQDCWSQPLVEGLDAAWALSASRPSFVALAVDPTYDRVAIATDAGLQVQWFAAFPAYTPTEGSARFASLLQGRWPGAKRDAAEQAFLDAQAARVASEGPAAFDAVSDAIAAHQGLLPGAQDSVFTILYGQDLQELVDSLGDEWGTPGRFSVGYAQGKAPEGYWAHAITLVAE